jgi:hypothetical protein
MGGYPIFRASGFFIAMACWAGQFHHLVNDDFVHENFRLVRDFGASRVLSEYHPDPYHNPH